VSDDDHLLSPYYFKLLLVSSRFSFLCHPRFDRGSMDSRLRGNDRKVRSRWQETFLY